MASQTSGQSPRLEDTFLPAVGLASSNNKFPSASRRPKQTARKSTGGLPPRKTPEMEGSSLSRSSSIGLPIGQSRSARKSTGGLPPKTVVSPQTVKMPNRTSYTNQTLRKSPLPHRGRSIEAIDSAETGIPGTSNRISSDGRRTSQTARKSTGGGVPPKRLEVDDVTEGSSSPLPQPSIPAHEPVPITPCDLCSLPLQIASHSIIDLSQPIYSLAFVCRHNFHYSTCYMRYLTTAPTNLWAFCPTCQANLLTDGRYWVHVCTNSGNRCYTDITEEVEERRQAVQLARLQIFFDSLSHRNLHIAGGLLTGPDSVDVNFQTPLGGLTPLHFCAMNDDAEGISFLLSHGADKHQRAEDGLLPVDYAKSHNALNAAERLA